MALISVFQAQSQAVKTLAMPLASCVQLKNLRRSSTAL